MLGPSARLLILQLLCCIKVNCFRYWCLLNATNVEDVMHFECNVKLYEYKFTAISVCVGIRTKHCHSDLYLLHACVCMCVKSLWTPSHFKCKHCVWFSVEATKSTLRFPNITPETDSWRDKRKHSGITRVCICSVSSEAVKVKLNKQPSAIYAHITSTCAISKLQNRSEASQQHHALKVSQRKQHW